MRSSFYFSLILTVPFVSCQNIDDKLSEITDTSKVKTVKSVEFQLLDSLKTPFDTINNQILTVELYDSVNMIGKNVLITCGGMGAKLEWVASWTKELYTKKLKEFNIGMVCIIRGPREEYYDSRDIVVPELTRKFVKAYEKYRLNYTFFIVHSSGVFPAHQMFDLLYTGSIDSNKFGGKKEPVTNYDSLGITKEKIIYIMLDGEPGIPRGYTLTKGMVDNLKKIISVYAKDEATQTKSGMYKEAIRIKPFFPDKTVDYLIKSKNSGCNKGATWCVHETVITTKPHNPAKYDLEKDYQKFGGDTLVVTEYMDSVKTVVK